MGYILQQPNSLYIPCSEKHTEDSKTDNVKAVIPVNDIPNFTSKQILLVEDNEINQQVAKGLLELSNCSTIIVTNGQESVEKIASGSQVDFVLMDIQMEFSTQYPVVSDF